MPQLPAPGYSRQWGQPAPNRIVHIGVGGFHRAHQALYTHLLAERQGRLEWSICGVGLLPADAKMRDILNQQQGIYTLVQRGPRAHLVSSFEPYSIRGVDDKTDPQQPQPPADGAAADSSSFEYAAAIGSITEYIYAADDKAELLTVLADPATKIITLTVTESGYYLDSEQRLNVDHQLIQSDLRTNAEGSAKTAIGTLVLALQQRRAKQCGPLTIQSCDNIPMNGERVHRAVADFAARLPDAEALTAYIEANVAFPSSMVDSITPVTTPSLVEHVATQYGAADQWPVVCEAFHDWVIEDRFPAGRPDWSLVGAKFVDDVKPYELMKLRLLNGAHSCLSYIATLLGHTTVDGAMADPLIREHTKAYMLQMVHAVPPVPGVDLQHYICTLIERFGNVSISDQLSRLCMDGSSKFVFFVNDGTQQLLAERRNISAIALSLAAWIVYLNATPLADIRDPAAGDLKKLAQLSCSFRSGLSVLRLVMPELANDRVFNAELGLHLHNILHVGPGQAVKLMLARLVDQNVINLDI